MSTEVKVFGVFFCILLAAGVVFFTIGVRNVHYSSRSREWPSTQGTIVSANVDSISMGSGTRSYGPVVTYTYAVAGHEYRSSRISFHDESGDQQWAASVCDRYPTGTVVDVFYDPSRPERAVLQPGFKLRGGVIVPFVFGIVFAGLAFAGPLPKMLRALKRSRR